KSQSQEEHAPPEAGHQQPPQKCSDGGAGPRSSVDRGIRQAAAAFGKRPPNARTGGGSEGSADAQQQPQREQRLEPPADSRAGGGGGPEQEPAGVNPAHVEAVHQPPGHREKLARGIGPEKRGEKQPDPIIRK